jgi:hypothetical protein
MGLKGGFIHIGLMDKKVIRSVFVLNDIEAEGARLVPQALAGMFPNEGDVFVHVDLHQARDAQGYRNLSLRSRCVLGGFLGTNVVLNQQNDHRFSSLGNGNKENGKGSKNAR